MSKPFFNAIKKGNRDKVKRLLGKNPDLIRTKNEDGLSPIMLAAYYHESELVDLLAERMLSFTIFEAAATGRLVHIIRCLARDPAVVNSYSDDGFQPLGLAAYFGHEDIAEYLIKAGAEVNSPSRNDLSVTPLQSAVAGDNLKITRMLIEAGADPNVRERGKFTPLHAAAQNGNIDIIRTLIFGGADVEARSKKGKLPLDIALEAGHNEVAELLKEGITRRFRASRISKQ